MPAVAVLAIAVLCAIAASAGAVDDPRQTDLLSIGPTGGNGSTAAIAGGASDNGSHVFFQTAESLTSNDTDGGYQDVYERFNGTTTLVSAGGNGPFDAHFSGCSADGSHVFFETNEQLAPTDTDATQDVYDRSGGTTTELSLGPIGGNGAQDAFFIFNSADGNKVFFESYEQLTTNDTNAGYRDVYLRTLSSSTTSLISIGSIGGGGSFGAQIDGITPDGSHAYFHTDEALTANDTDGGAQDIYDRFGSSTTRVSTGTNGGNTASKDAFFEAASTSGSHVFFTTPEQIEPGDTDSTRDIYDRSGGVTTLRSTGPNGGNGPYSVIFGGATTDGSKIWFDTREALVAGDTTAAAPSRWRRCPASTSTSRPQAGRPGSRREATDRTTLSTPPARTMAPGFFFHTTERLDPLDTDGGYDDVYQRYNGTTSLVSYGGNGPHQAVSAASRAMVRGPSSTATSHSRRTTPTAAGSTSTKLWRSVHPAVDGPGLPEQPVGGLVHLVHRRRHEGLLLHGREDRQRRHGHVRRHLPVRQPPDAGLPAAQGRDADESRAGAGLPGVPEPRRQPAARRAAEREFL